MDIFKDGFFRKPIIFIVLLFINILSAPVTIKTVSHSILYRLTRTKVLTEAYLEWDIDSIFITKAFVISCIVTCFTHIRNVPCLVLTILDLIWPILKNSLTLVTFAVIRDQQEIIIPEQEDHNSGVIGGTCLLLNVLNLVILLRWRN